MREALIGHSGFVGANLARQHAFSDLFNSRNIEEIAGHAFDRVVCAAAPGVKWLANQKPEEDRAAIDRLMRALRHVETGCFVLISTVDVYPDPVLVDESHAIDPTDLSPYGRHRRELELFAESVFGANILRLHGLFGRGLKKNVIYDFLHDNQLDRIVPGSRYQFYDLANLWSDVKKTIEHGIPLLNLATEPVSVAELAGHVFGREIQDPHVAAPASYDFRSRHDHLWAGSNGYLYDRMQVLTAMRMFVAAEQERLER